MYDMEEKQKEMIHIVEDQRRVDIHVPEYGQLRDILY